MTVPRRVAFLVALVLAVMVGDTALASADVVRGPAVAPGVIAAGTVRDTAGGRRRRCDCAAVPGPADRRVRPVGATLVEPLVAQTITRRDGTYSLVAPNTPAVRAAASANGGYANFELGVVGKGLAGGTNFSRAAGTTSTGALAWAPTDVAADAIVQEAPPAADVTLTELAPVAAAPAAGAGPTAIPGCIWKTIAIANNRMTIIGEVRNWADSRVSWEYGSSADSDISVGFSPDGAHWSLSGTAHVGTSNSVTVGLVDDPDRVAEYMRSQFQYRKYRRASISCPHVYKTMATAWQSGLVHSGRIINVYDGHCNIRAHHSWYGSRTAFDRNTKRAGEVNGAVNVFGINLKSTSGFSRWVHLHYHFGTRRKLHWLCGDSDGPTASNHVFAGP